MRTLEAKNVRVRIGGRTRGNSATPACNAGWRVFGIVRPAPIRSWGETKALLRGFMTIIFRVRPVKLVTDPVKLFTGQRANLSGARWLNLLLFRRFSRWRLDR